MKSEASDFGFGAILWDLDGTLWDHAGAVEWALGRFCRRNGLDHDLFRPVYLRHSDRLWGLYEEGRATVEEVRRGRFQEALEELAISVPDLDGEIEHYLTEYGSQPRLLPGAIDVLERLHGQVPMALITNGFADTQRAKLAGADLGRFFDAVAISAEVGLHKPCPGLFHHALGGLGVPPAAALHIGDSWAADVLGAAAAGLAGAIWVRRDGAAPGAAPPAGFRFAAVDRLSELLPLLGRWIPRLA